MSRELISSLHEHIRRRGRALLPALVLAVLVLGCTVPGQSATSTGPSVADATDTMTPSPAPTSTSSPTPSPTATPTATLTPTPTNTATPTPTPTPTHPLMVEVMRQQSYPGSDIVFEETLAPGVNYDRYIVSYLSEGLKIYALLTVPQGEPPDTGWPVIIFNHGHITPSIYRTTERYIAYTDAFSRNGYIVLKSDYRGHGFSEGEPTNSYFSPAYTVDVLNGMASVIALPEADPNRVGMWGHSMGGSITLRAMVVTDTIKAGVIWAGVTAPYPMIIQLWAERWADRPTPTPNPDATAVDLNDELYRLDQVDANRAFWEAIDPFSYLDQISGPIQIHHGTADESVPLEFSEILNTSLQEAGQVSELFTYPGDNHNISNNFGVAAQRSVDFFDQYVKGPQAGP